MNISTPIFLAALGLLVPIVLAFLVRKPKKEILRVPSTLVWRLGAKSIVKTKRIKDIRRLLALLACALGVAALVVAAARPVGTRADTVVYVVDVSASMAGKPMDEAKRWMKREISGMGPSARVAIVLAGIEARSILPPSAPGPLVDQAIDGIVVQHDTSSLEEAVALAQGLELARTVILSDGPVDTQITEHDPKPFVRAFPHASQDNLGIASLFTRIAPDARDESEREATVVVAAAGTAKRHAKLTVSLGGKTVGERHIVVEGEATERFAIRGAGKLVAHVAPDDGKSDALTIDDDVLLEETTRKPPSVLLVRPKENAGAASYFVERAVRAAGVTEIYDIEPDAVKTPKADVAIVTQDGPARPSDVPTFYLGVEPTGLGLEAKTVDRSGTRVRSIATDDALVRGVALDEMTTLKARVLTHLPTQSRSLVDLDSGPALVAGGTGQHEWVWLGIDAQSSDLVLRVAFPVLVGNVLAELSGAAQVVSGHAIPRSEIALAAEEVKAPLPTASEPRWRIPTSASMLLAALGAFLLALEAWLTFKKRWAL